MWFTTRNQAPSWRMLWMEQNLKKLRDLHGFFLQVAFPTRPMFLIWIWTRTRLWSSPRLPRRPCLGSEVRRRTCAKRPWNKRNSPPGSKMRIIWNMELPRKLSLMVSEANSSIYWGIFRHYVPWSGLMKTLTSTRFSPPTVSNWLVMNNLSWFSSFGRVASYEIFKHDVS